MFRFAIVAALLIAFVGRVNHVRAQVARSYFEMSSRCGFTLGGSFFYRRSDAVGHYMHRYQQYSASRMIRQPGSMGTVARVPNYREQSRSRMSSYRMSSRSYGDPSGGFMFSLSDSSRRETLRKQQYSASHAVRRTGSSRLRPSRSRSSPVFQTGHPTRFMSFSHYYSMR